MADFEDSIAHKAHGLVHGERAKTYGHPRFDFTAIGKVWTGLLQDVLKEGVVLDPYRVAILMTGLKLCRLVKSPKHKDSRVDTIGYMLTMERLDEPEEAAIRRAEHSMQEDLDDEVTEGAWGAPNSEYQDEEGPFTNPFWRDDNLKFSEVSVWFEAGESKYINGNVHVNSQAHGRSITFPFATGTRMEIKPVPRSFPEFGTPEFDARAEKVAAEQAKDWPKVRCPAHGNENCEACAQNPDPSRCQCGYFESTGMHWDTCPGRIRSFPSENEESRDSKVMPRSAETKVHEVHGGAVPCWCGHFGPVHNHKAHHACVPGCPVFDAEVPKFGFTGEQVEMEQEPWTRGD